MKKNLLLILLLLVFIFLLAGCQSVAPTESYGVTESSPMQESTNAYPSPVDESPETAYPAAQDTALGDPNKIQPPEPESGMASISGLLVQESTNHPLNNMMVYLTKAVGENKDVPIILTSPQNEKGDVMGASDAQGYLAINNIPPGDYYMVVNYVTNWMVVEVSKDNPVPRLITVKTDQKLKLGRISVPDN